MSTPSQARRNSHANPAQDYRSALAEYLLSRSEAALGRAYEIGRESLQSGVSLVELSAVHHAALAEVLHAGAPDAAPSAVLEAAAEFLANSLSPYEMAHRGFQDAVAALRRMNETLEEQIRRIAHAVHDEAGQLLVYVHLALAELAREVAPSLKESFDRIKDLLKQVESQLRQYSHELRPPVLDDLGLVPAVRFLADSVFKRTGLPVRVVAENIARLDSAAEIALYRVIQEALNNTIKHAKAGSALVLLRDDHSNLHCTIEDDGVGFDSGSAQARGGHKGLGLIGMQERIKALGGNLEITSSFGSGTRILLHLPNSAKEKSDAHSRSARG